MVEDTLGQEIKYRHFILTNDRLIQKRYIIRLALQGILQYILQCLSFYRLPTNLIAESLKINAIYLGDLQKIFFRLSLE